MAEKLGLDNNVNELKLGSSFEGGPVAYHSIRYDFKPASVDTSQVASVDIGEGNSVTVTLPHVEGSGTAHTVYKGNKKPCQKECVIIIDHESGEITLEKLATNIQLKKTSRVPLDSGMQGERRWKGKDGEKLQPMTKESCKSSCREKRPKSNCDIHKELVAKRALDRQEIAHPVVLENLERLNLSNPSSLEPVATARNGEVSGKLEIGSPDVLRYAKSIENDIANFLRSHQIETKRRPYVSKNMSIQKFNEQHPELYGKAKRRQSFDDGVLDSLNSYLCSTFSSYMVDSSNIYGCMQRLEDVVDFVLRKFTSSVKI